MTTTVIDSPVSPVSSTEKRTTATGSPVEISMLDEQVPAVSETASTELIFGQKHNNIDCALCPTAKRKHDRAWVSAKNVEVWSKMPKMTLWRWLEKLEKARRISLVSDMILVNVPTTTGAKSTKFYNLNVLNQLAMVCIDNEKLNEVSCQFSDMLSDKETEGMSGTQPQPMMCLPQDYESALEALLASVREKKRLEAERDEAIRTKCHFVEGRDAKVCGELGGLRTQNEALRKKIGDAKKYKAVTAISWLPDYFDISNRGLYGSLAAKLKKLEAEMPPSFAHIDIEDSRYGTVKAYHVGVIERLHEMVQADETLMAKYRKIASV